MFDVFDHSMPYCFEGLEAYGNRCRKMRYANRTYRPRIPKEDWKRYRDVSIMTAEMNLRPILTPLSQLNDEPYESTLYF